MSKVKFHYQLFDCRQFAQERTSFKWNIIESSRWEVLNTHDVHFYSFYQIQKPKVQNVNFVKFRGPICQSIRI